MKIEKLYTLSQFVDYVKHSDSELEGLFSKRQFKKLNLIFAYNEFLKQPLKKEMFVNEIEIPSALDVGICSGNPSPLYNQEMKIWQEAEKKVIFDIAFSNDSNCLIVNKNQSIIKFESGTSNKTINYLAENTDGNLKLKNIEI